MLLEVGWSVPTGKIVSSVVQGKLMEKVLLDLFLMYFYISDVSRVVIMV